MHTRLFAPLLLAGLSARAPVHSQEPGSRPAEPAPFLSVTMAGPGAVVRSALPTNLGTLLAGEACRPMWNQLREAVRAGHAAEWDGLEQRLLAWQGRIDLSLFVDREPRAGGRVRHRFRGEILLWSDPDGDLDALALALRRYLVAVAGAEPDALDLGNGERIEVSGPAEREGWTLPMPWNGGHQVLFFGERVGEAATRGLLRLKAVWPARQEQAKATPLAGGQIAEVRLDGAQLATLIGDEVHRAEERALVQTVLGTKSWGEARCRVGTQGPHLEVELTADFRDADRGVLGVFLPEATSLPALAARGPAAQADRPSAFLAAHVHLDRAFQLFLTVMSHLRDGQRSREEVRKDLTKDLGFDLERDFLAHLDTEVLGVAHLTEAVLEQDRAAPDADGLCFLMRVKDDAAFAKSFDRLAAHKDLKPAPKILQAGFEVVPVRFLDRGEYFARAPGWFCYAIGPRGLLALEQLARTLAAPDPKGAPLDLPRAARGMKRRIPPGWNALGVLSARILRDSLAEEGGWELWKELRSGLPRPIRPDWSREELTRRNIALAEVLEKARLGELVLMGGFERAPTGGVFSRARLVLWW